MKKNQMHSTYELNMLYIPCGKPLAIKNVYLLTTFYVEAEKKEKR